MRIEERLGDGFVRLRVEEAERRQAAHDIRCVEDAVIELLRNARDAQASHIFLASAKVDQVRTLTMIDDGSGVPRELWSRIFDARVTSKLETVHVDRWGVHGRGMALFSIRENALSAAVIDSVRDGGTSIQVSFDTQCLPEKADQSSWPRMGKDEQGAIVIERGPHNIIRTCAEFALEEHGLCDVYVGSCAEVAATLRAQPVRHSVASLATNLQSFPLATRFRLAADARELAEVAASCGLEMSERTAQRIISGQIRPLSSVLARLTREERPSQRRPVDLEEDQRGLRLSQKDRTTFTAMLERDFAYLADRYYLRLVDSPRLRVSGNRLSIIFEYEGED